MVSLTCLPLALVVVDGVVIVLLIIELVVFAFALLPTQARLQRCKNFPQPSTLCGGGGSPTHHLPPPL